MPVASDELVPPAFLWVPPRAGSFGDDAIDMAALFGLSLDAAQRLAVDAFGSVDESGLWTTLEDAIIEPRQNGKTVGVLMPIALAAAILVPDQLVVWSAHRYKTSHEAFLAMLRLYRTSPEFAARVLKPSYSNGEEAFEFHNGSRIIFVARSQASGRGLSGDLVILDEALFLTPAMMGALFPTLSARPNPKVIYASSAGLASSQVLREVRDRGRAGGDPSLCWVEWCAPEGGCASPDCDHAKTAVGCMLDDPANWRLSNTAIAAGRMTVEYIAKERRALPVAEFMRERMGWWEAPEAGGLFHMPSWWRLVDPDSTPGDDLVFGVHVTPDRSASSVLAASVRGDGKVHLELVEHRAGVSWLLPFLADRTERHSVSAVVIAGAMAAGALAPDMESLPGFVALSSTDVRRACGAFFDAVNADPRVLAVAVHPDLDDAVMAAGRSSDRGEWVFSAAPETDLSPLYAAALALWVARTREEEPDYDLSLSVY